MPPSTVRNRVPRVRPGAPRDWTRLDRHERAVLAALYANALPMTYGDLGVATGIGKQPLSETLSRLGSPQRCAALGPHGIAVERHDRPAADPDAPPFAPLYTVPKAWLLAHGPIRYRA